MGPGSTISIMCILLIIDIIISWRLVSMVYDKQWDVKSSMIIYGVITAIYSIGTVGFISDLVPENKQNITLIMGIPFIILMIVINVLMFIAVRKLKYVEASIPLQAHQELKKYKGSLKEENMVCLVPRKEIFNVQVYLEIAKRKNQQELEDIEIIDNKDTKTIASDKSKSWLVCHGFFVILIAMDTHKKKYTIGIDEAGRGPWAGPVVAAAASFEDLPKEVRDQLADSKKLSEKKREQLFDTLVQLWTQGKIFYGVGVSDSSYIDTNGIKPANKFAMQQALDECIRRMGSKAEHINTTLVDGNDKFEFDGLKKPALSIIKGDDKIPEIQAASILAKVFRDKLMDSYATIYPQYGLEHHKGYGTKKHQESLQDKSQITNIHRTSYKPVKKILEHKPKLLLHVCCGPDATVPFMDLKDQYDIIAFWYDPNIHPKAEYDKRLKAFEKVCEIENIPFIEWEYDTENFDAAIKGLENTPEQGAKCTACYDLRLKRSVIEAQKQNCDAWTTSLNISPHKSFTKLSKIGKNLGEEYNIQYLDIPFIKNHGFNRSVEYCKTHDIYRQNYCGCIYSDTYPGKKQRKKK